MTTSLGEYPKQALIAAPARGKYGSCAARGEAVAVDGVGRRISSFFSDPRMQVFVHDDDVLKQKVPATAIGTACPIVGSRAVATAARITAVDPSRQLLSIQNYTGFRRPRPGQSSVTAAPKSGRKR